MQRIIDAKHVGKELMKLTSYSTKEIVSELVKRDGVKVNSDDYERRLMDDWESSVIEFIGKDDIVIIIPKEEFS